MTDQKLLSYFMDQTNKRFDKVDDNFAAIHLKLENLGSFKCQEKADKKWLSWIFTAIIGILSFSISIGTSLYISKQEHESLMDAARLEKDIPFKKDHS